MNQLRSQLIYSFVKIMLNNKGILKKLFFRETALHIYGLIFKRKSTTGQSKVNPHILLVISCFLKPECNFVYRLCTYPCSVIISFYVWLIHHIFINKWWLIKSQIIRSYTTGRVKPEPDEYIPTKNEKFRLSFNYAHQNLKNIGEKKFINHNYSCPYGFDCPCFKNYIRAFQFVFLISFNIQRRISGSIPREWESQSKP